MPARLDLGAEMARPRGEPGLCLDTGRIVHSMLWSRCRRATGTYLVLFFLAVAAAPHHHLNGLEDLLLDQPSDSGVFVESGAPLGADGAPAWSYFRLVDDDPCLACFNRDFVSAPAPILAFAVHLDRLAPPPPAASRTAPARVVRDTSSRAPPALS